MKTFTDSNYGKPILVYSITHKSSTEAIMGLLANGADPNMAAPDGMTPLVAAIKENNTTVVKALLKKGADHKPALSNGSTLLHFAVKKPNTGPIVRALLEAGFDPDERDYASRTPLMDAVCSRTTSMNAIRLLIEHGADVNAQDWTGVSVLTLAVHEEKLEVVKELLYFGADIYRGGRMVGLSAIHEAAEYNQSPGIIRELIKSGGNVNFAERWNQTTPLHSSMKNSNPCAFLTLMSLGANVNAIDKLGNTVLDFCVMNFRPALMGALLQYQPKNLIDEGGDSPLSFACWVGAVEAVRMLVPYPNIDATRMQEFLSSIVNLVKMFEAARAPSQETYKYPLTPEYYKNNLSILKMLNQAVEKIPEPLPSGYLDFVTQSKWLMQEILTACPKPYSMTHRRVVGVAPV